MGDVGRRFVTALLALLSAVFVGSADFLGGLTSRSANGVRVAASVSAAGLPLALAVALVVPGRRRHARRRGLVLAGRRLRRRRPRLLLPRDGPWPDQRGRTGGGRDRGGRAGGLRVRARRTARPCSRRRARGCVRGRCRGLDGTLRAAPRCGRRRPRRDRPRRRGRAPLRALLRLLLACLRGRRSLAGRDRARDGDGGARRLRVARHPRAVRRHRHAGEGGRRDRGTRDRGDGASCCSRFSEAPSRSHRSSPRSTPSRP